MAAHPLSPAAVALFFCTCGIFAEWRAGMLPLGVQGGFRERPFGPLFCRPPRAPSFGVCASYIYDFSANGIGYLFGEWLGPFTFVALIAFAVTREKNPVPVALCFALVNLITARTKDIIAVIDERDAASVLANVKSVDDLDEAIKDYPNNLMIQMIGAAISVKQQTELRLQNLAELN